MESATIIPDRPTLPDGAARLLRTVRPDLLIAMRLLDRGATREAFMRLSMCVAALDDTLAEIDR